MENAFAREFSKYYEVFLLATTLEPINNTERFSSGKEDYRGIEIKRLKVFKIGRNKTLFYPKNFIRNINNINPDIVFFQSLEHYLVGLALVLNKFIKGYKLYTVVNEHFTYSRQIKNERAKNTGKIKSKIEDLIKYLILKYSDKIITMNSYCYKKALFYNNNIKKNTVPVTLGVNTKDIKFNLSKRIEIRRKFLIKENEILLIHTGKIYPDKKTHLIIEAVSKINNPDVKIIFVGKYDKDYKEYLHKIVEKYKLEVKVIFVEFVESKDLCGFYSASDIAVWPDLLTISTIEASAVGLPVIIPDYEGYEHRVKNNNGFAIKPGDLKELTNKLEVLINDCNLRKEMGKRGIELVEKELNWEIIAKKIV
jgi:glycosyltransferase involved in cell wall biosynthesis